MATSTAPEKPAPSTLLALLWSMPNETPAPVMVARVLRLIALHRVRLTGTLRDVQPIH